MKTLIASFLIQLISLNVAFAADIYKCVGETEQEVLTFKVMSAKELIRFKGAKRGIELIRLERELCEGYISIDPDSEESYFITATAADISAMKTALNVWDGNWGYEIKVPNKVFEGKLTPKESFKMNYKFVYNDIAEAEVIRTLNCQNIR
jgi:hypothetical protein